MKYLLSLPLLVLILSFPLLYKTQNCPCDKCPDIQPDIMRDMINPYVEVDASNDEESIMGAGTVLTVNGKVVVLTAGHMAHDMKTFQIKKEAEEGHKAVVWNATLLAIKFDDDGDDLALLLPQNPDGLVSAYFTGTVSLVRGEEAWVVGTNGGLHASLEKTIINRPLYYSTGADWGMVPFRDAPRIMVNGNVWYGNSGGGLFVSDNGHYVLVGVIVELSRQGEKAPSLAVTQDCIKKFLQESMK